MYHQGRGVITDYGQAHFWYRKAIAQGYGMAQSNMGLLYRYGHRVAQNFPLAYM